MSDLRDRVALVTGASRGIGSACAKALAAEGARVAVGFRNDKDNAILTAEECPGSTTVHIDVTDTETVAAAFDEVEKTLGPVEILVNNAGVAADGLLMRMSESDWDAVLDTNLKGAFRCTKRALPSMLREGWGRIVNIGSIVGHTGNAGQANYAAAKAGLIGFTKSVSQEAAKRGVTANVVSPGYVETEMTAGLSDEQKAKLISRVPAGRTGLPEEVAAAVVFCAKSAYLTGQSIQLNGGMN